MAYSHIKNKIDTVLSSVDSRAWYGMEDDFSIFHTGNFLLFHFHFIPKIFHSLLPYQGKFRLKAMCNLHYTFAMLSVLLPKIAHEGTGKQYGAIHLILYLKHYRNDLP